MAEYSGLTSLTPPTLAFDDPDSYWLGVEFYVTEPCTLTQVKFFNGADGYDTVRDVAVYEVETGALLTPVDQDGRSLERFNESPLGMWNAHTLSSPIVLTPNAYYRATVQFPNGRYSVTTSFYRDFDGMAGMTNGPLVLPSHHDTVHGQNTFETYLTNNPLPLNPTNGSGGNNYWIDVTVSDGVSDPEDSANWSVWDGTTELPVTVEGVWNGTTVEPIASTEVVED